MYEDILRQKLRRNVLNLSSFKCVCVCVYQDMCVPLAYTQMSETNFQELVLSFHRSFWGLNSAARLAQQCFYPLSHLGCSPAPPACPICLPASLPPSLPPPFPHFLLQHYSPAWAGLKHVGILLSLWNAENTGVTTIPGTSFKNKNSDSFSGFRLQTLLSPKMIPCIMSSLYASHAPICPKSQDSLPRTMGAVDRTLEKDIQCSHPLPLWAQEIQHFLLGSVSW